eukprot:442120_1
MATTLTNPINQTFAIIFSNVPSHFTWKDIILNHFNASNRCSISDKASNRWQHQIQFNTVIAYTFIHNKSIYMTTKFHVSLQEILIKIPIINISKININTNHNNIDQNKLKQESKYDVYSCTVISPIINNKQYSCTNLLYERNKRCNFDEFRIITDEYDYVLSIVMNGIDSVVIDKLYVDHFQILLTEKTTLTNFLLGTSNNGG